MNTKTMPRQTGRGDALTNGALGVIEHDEPYRFQVKIKGDADILFHRWNCEAVDSKAKAAKGSAAKKSDDIESYVWRNDDDQICIPGEYLRATLVAAAKFQQDPRSPRKSAMDLVKAGLITLTPLAPLGSDKWDYVHACRVQIQRNGITRMRPAFRAGWEAEFIFAVTLPQYLNESFMLRILKDAGMLIGIADFRPSYGRFSVIHFEVLNDCGSVRRG